MPERSCFVVYNYVLFLSPQLILLKRKLFPRRRANRDSNPERVWQRKTSLTLTSKLSPLLSKDDKRGFSPRERLETGSPRCLCCVSKKEDRDSWEGDETFFRRCWMELAGERISSHTEQACKSTFTPLGASETFVQHTLAHIQKHRTLPPHCTPLLMSCPRHASPFMLSKRET